MTDTNYLEPPTPQPLGRFNPTAERSRLRAHAEPFKAGTGYVAQVVDGPTSKVVYDSFASFQKHGVFPEAALAEAQAERWIDKRLEQLEKIRHLQARRQAELTDRLDANLDAQRIREQEIEHHKKATKAAQLELERLQRYAAALVRDAKSPQVELDFHPDHKLAKVIELPSVWNGADPDGKPTAQLELSVSDEVDLDDRCMGCGGARGRGEKPLKCPTCKCEGCSGCMPLGKGSSCPACLDAGKKPDKGKKGGKKGDRTAPPKPELAKGDPMPSVGTMVVDRKTKQPGEIVEVRPAARTVRVDFGGRKRWCKLHELDAVKRPPDDTADTSADDSSDTPKPQGLDPRGIFWPDESEDT